MDATDGAFVTTVWHRIREAQAGRTTAVNDLLERYRPAILRYLRRTLGPEDAEDVAQQVLLALADRRLLSQADASRGRFRALVLSIARNLRHNHRRDQGAAKRGGDARFRSLDAATETSGALGERIAAPDSEEEFDREWARGLFELAMDRLAREHPKYAETIGLHLAERLSYRDLAVRLGKSESVVSNYLVQGKRKLAEYMREEVSRYSSSAGEFRDELERLSAYVSGSGKP